MTSKLFFFTIKHSCERKRMIKYYCKVGGKKGKGRKLMGPAGNLMGIHHIMYTVTV
jgi:hypothetical protein